MYTIYYKKKKKKDIKRMKKRGKDISKITSVLSILATGNELTKSFHDHQLSGNRTGFRECHIESDWILIYRIENELLILTATETGTHSDLFNL